MPAGSTHPASLSLESAALQLTGIVLATTRLLSLESAALQLTGIVLATTRLNLHLHLRDQVHGHLFVDFAHLELVATV